eukprot:CAMPEP_0177725088 /NCGR_PEP_ID=MMETSP0484_2-20121128/19062_1 /TAXON_ID=354590 /ORGANISM="Rhodomonas lens, Strain RHODO" /LENGTH=562 /DNA_ID=CAMNT_0019237573 /DNA_START=465 /DNA_END=2153 /DNA_ORIENTATION=+
MPNHANEECRAVQVARAFFQAATKLSEDNEDILPQEDGADQKLSVFHLFSELFPEYANDKDRDGTSGKNGLMRLQFNKIGYEMYEKEQSRRVPAVRAKPGNPGYGFRRARWRNTIDQGEDRRVCESVLRGLGVSQERIDRIRKRVSDFREEWDTVRRPSRPAGPGRPRGHKRSAAGDGAEGALGTEGSEPATIAATTVAPATPKKSKKTSKARPGPLSGGPEEGVGVAVSATWQPKQEGGAGAGGGVLLGPGGAASTVVAEAVGATLVDGTDWQQADTGPEWVDRVQGGVRGRGKEAEEGGTQPHVQTLMDENASLRSLNMSLIYEREKVLRELRESDQQLAEMQSSIEALLSAHTHKNAGPEPLHLAVAFRWLCNKLAGRTRGLAGEAGQEIPGHLRQVLEHCFDAYDEYQRNNEARGEGDDYEMLLMDERRGGRQGGFLELHLAKGGSPSEDLRVELSRMAGGAGRGGGPKKATGSTPSASSASSSLHPHASLRGAGGSGEGVVVKKEKLGEETDGEEHALGDHSFVHDNNPDEDMCDSDMGDVGSYDYLFAHCSAATAF